MLELRTLGGLELRQVGNGIPASIPLQTKRLVLLAHLAALPSGDYRRRDCILALFWPDLDQEHARGALRQALHALRTALGDGVIRTRGESEVGIDDSVLRSDAVGMAGALQAGRPAEALALYRGDFLDGVFVAGASPELEEWIAGERTRLRQLGARAAWGVAEGSPARGDAGDAVRQAVQLSGADESALRRGIELLDHMGDHAGAIALYEEFAQRMARDLEVEPSTETRSVIASIRARSAPAPVERLKAEATALAPLSDLLTVSPPTSPGRRRRLTVAGGIRGVAATAALLVLLTAALGILRPWRKAAAPLDPSLLAVIPFDVSDPSLAVWSEGVVDFLSRTLDGAGPLRSVAPSQVIGGWNGRSDRASARAVAHRVGAGLAVTGDLSRRGPDSVDIRGVLFDIARGSVLGEVAVGGPDNRVGELVDSLAIGLLRALSRDRPVAAVRRSMIGAAPLPALKAFLRGEQFYRRALFDSALAAYAETIERDSMLAFASFRMGRVLGWSPATAGAYEGYGTYLTQAHLHNRGLGERDSLIVAADSAWQVAAVSAGRGIVRPELYRLAFGRLNQLMQIYPRDPEVWYELGEMLYHTEPGLGQDQPRALGAFDRAIALDSSFAPPWEHELELAIRYRGVDEARRYARAFGATPATTAVTLTAKLASRLLLDSTGLRDTGLMRTLDSAPPVALLRLGHEHFLYIPDSAETAIALLRLLDARSSSEIGSQEWFADSLLRHQVLAFALMMRGHLHDAAEIDRRLIAEPGASSLSWFRDPFFYLALLGALPAAEVDSVYRVSLQPGVSLGLANTRALLGLTWWAQRHDTSAIRSFGERMREAGLRADIPSQRARATYLGVAAQAYLALSRGDTAAALHHFDAIPPCPWTADPVFCNHSMLTQATASAGRGALLPAAAILDTLLASSSGLVNVFARLKRAELAESLLDHETARRHYQFAVDAWRRADPDLKPYLDKARSGLNRITGRRS